MRTAGNAVFINGIITTFHREFYPHRDKGFLKTKIMEERLVDFDGIKCRIAKKGFRIDQRMLLKKSARTGIKALESARDLSSSGESDFFSMMISGWTSRKSLL